VPDRRALPVRSDAAPGLGATGFGGLVGLTTNPPMAGEGQFAGRPAFSGMVTPV